MVLDGELNVLILSQESSISLKGQEYLDSAY